MTESAEFASLTADDLVSGEGVALDLPPAGLALRAASGLLDVLLASVLLFGAAMALFLATAGTDQALAWVAFLASLILAFLVLPTTVETVTRGRSLGKRVVGLRTVRDDGGPISFHHAFVRSLVGLVEVYLLGGIGAFFSGLVSPRGKRLGDHAAGTYVVRERVRLELPPPVQMPAGLSAWAAGADVTGLPTPLALAVRQFLHRAGLITPEAHARIGDRLADQVLAHVAPPPPPGTSSEAFLAAVVATRRERDARRLAREASTRDRLLGRGRDPAAESRQRSVPVRTVSTYSPVRRS